MTTLAERTTAAATTPPAGSGDDGSSDDGSSDGQTSDGQTSDGQTGDGQTSDGGESGTPGSGTTIPPNVGVDDTGLVPDDEPSFDSEPLQELAIGVIELPPDDTGISATIPVTVAPADPDDAANVIGGWAAFDAALRDALLRNGNTAVGVAVAIDGEVVHEAAFGARVPGAGIAAQADHRFRIASISKPITALALLTLVADGTVGLDEPLGTTIADHLGLENPSASSRRLTVRRLLNHTTGYGKFDTQFFRGGSEDCRDAAVDGLRSGGGAGGYIYSNMNYCLAGLLIEALTGLDYEDAVYRRVLTPLGISGMRVPPTEDPGPGEIQHVTTPGRNYMETLEGAGAWIAAPADLVALMDSLSADAPGVKLLPQWLATEMIRPAGGQLGQRGYGLGIISYGPGRFGHTGTIENTRAMVQHRGDGVTWAVTVAGSFPDDTPNLERFVNAAFVAAGFVAPD